MNTPLITKFKSNVVLYDSLGSANTYYSALTYDKNYIYFLVDTVGTVIRLDTKSEELTSIRANKNNTNDGYYIDNFEDDTPQPPFIPTNSIITYKGDLYAFVGYDVKQFTGDTVLYVKGSYSYDIPNQLVQESYDRKLNVVHLSSTSEIRDFAIDDDFNYYVIHNKNKLSKFTKERIPIYSNQIKSFTRNIFYTQLSVQPSEPMELLKIDFVREYTDSGLKTYPIVLGKREKDNELYLAKLDTEGNPISAKFLGISANYIPYGGDRINYNLTNYEYLKNTYPDKDEIVFKLRLKNQFNNEDFEDIEIPVSTEGFTSESHHFAFRLDGINGKVSVFKDGEKIEEIKLSSGKYIFQDIFTERMNIGNTYFHNSISLDEHLGQTGYYHIKNGSMSKFKVYKRALTDNEILFHVFENSKMDDLVVSLPCDQRSDVETVERQFKLDASGNKSNKVNIYIKNSQLTNTILQDQLKEIITEKMKKVLPVTTVINKIEFR